MSANGGWFAVDTTQRLIPMTDDAREVRAELQAPQERSSMERIALDIRKTDYIRICIKEPSAPAAPVVAPRRARLIAIAFALAAVVALPCLL